MDRQELPQRKTIRLQGYDYCEPGAYFVTICTAGKACVLGTIQDGSISLSRAGRIVEQCWLALPNHFPHIELDAYVIMPNHVHGLILVIGTLDSRRGEASAPRTTTCLSGLVADASPEPAFAAGTASGSLGAVVQNFKSVSTRRINAANGTPGASLWQRSYYEHVVRNQQSLDEIRQYIVGNPWNWGTDKYHPQT